MYPQRRQQLTRFLHDHGLDALVLRRPSSVAWAAGGARTHIDVTAETGVAWLVVTADETRVVTSRIEAGRLADEELTGSGYEWTVLDWVTDLTTAVPSGDRVGVDGPMPGRRDVSAELEVARRALLPEEVELYRALGRDAAEALTAAVATCVPGGVRVAVGRADGGRGDGAGCRPAGASRRRRRPRRAIPAPAADADPCGWAGHGSDLRPTARSVRQPDPLRR